MNELLKERLQEIIRICMQIIEEDYEKKIEWKRIFKGGDNVINFNPALWKISPETDSSKNAAIEFTEKEMRTMPQKIRTEIKKGRIPHVRRREDGRYEVRFQINGRKITATAQTLKAARAKFIERLREIFSEEPNVSSVKSARFGGYVTEWLEIAKKPYIKPTTYKFYKQTVDTYMIPKFGEREMRSIRAFELQKFMSDHVADGKHRTAKKLQLILNAVFDYAVADGVLDRSPMKKVVVANYEQERGTALTRAEEKSLVDALYEKPDSVNRQAFVFLCYTGLRRSELASVKIEGEWIEVTNAKLRLGKAERKRRIPISPMLRRVLPLINVEAIKAIAPNTLTGKFKILMPQHHLHELRHTFITRAQECGIPREYVSLWAGHSADGSITSTVYTHLAQFEDRQRSEIAKYIYDF